MDGEIDNTKKDKQPFFENEIVDKVFLQSSRAVSEANKYAVATYNGSEIHLTALKGLLLLYNMVQHLKLFLQEFFNFAPIFHIWKRV